MAQAFLPACDWGASPCDNRGGTSPNAYTLAASENGPTRAWRGSGVFHSRPGPCHDVSYSQQHKLARAQLLQQQRRHDDAANELRQVLAADPHDAIAHAMLAISLLELNLLKDVTIP